MLVNAEEQHRIEQFLYDEAALLDSHSYKEWLDLFAEDCRYWMPIRETRVASRVEDEFTRPGEMAFYDEDKDRLASRVRKITSPYAWSESPRPSTRRQYSNIRVLAVVGQELTVTCNFAFYRCALDTEIDWFVGRREDVLRKNDDSFLIARRSIFLDQTVINAKNMTQFF
jgi:biphenyl 2,3-dioxygenase subunit beta